MRQPHTALTRSTQALNRETRTADLLADSSAGIRRRILWIDGIGGYLLVDRDEILIGQAVSGSAVDVCIVGDLSRQAAALRRSDGDYLLQPLQPTWLNNQAVDRAQVLHDGDLFQIGNRVKVKFHKPSPLSATARLELVSLNRFKPSVDGVLLLAESCILGPNAGSHVLCPGWSNELLLFRHAGGWFFRAMEEVDVDGQPQVGQIPLVSGMRLRGEDFSLSIE